MIDIYIYIYSYSFFVASSFCFSAARFCSRIFIRSTACCIFTSFSRCVALHLNQAMELTPRNEPTAQLHADKTFAIFVPFSRLTQRFIENEKRYVDEHNVLNQQERQRQCHRAANREKQVAF